MAFGDQGLGSQAVGSIVGEVIGIGAALFGLPGPLTVNSTPLILDDIIFQAFEIPEKFGPLGGIQSIAKHDFPGGARTIQRFGAFPEDVVWTGILTGPTAGDREQALDRKRVSGQLVTLTFGRWSWSGYVTKFLAEIQNQFFIPYHMTFTPLQDLSGIATNPQGTTSAQATLAQDQSALGSTTNPSTAVQPLPAAMTPPVTAMQTSLSTGLLDGGGVISAIPAADLVAISVANDAVQATGAPILVLPNAHRSSPTLDAMNYSQASVNTINSINQPIATINVINPNLFQIAQQYYGDAALWIKIANANNIGSDPQPIGTFALVIPAP